MKTGRTKKADVLTRRDFLKTSTLAAAGAVLAGPTIVPSSVFGANKPSNRITLGCIGVGGMGIRDMKALMANPDTQVVAVCDVETGSNEYGSYYRGRNLGREPALEAVEKYYAEKSSSGQFKGCAAYIDFRNLLARSDVDAVTVCTPDHWHVPISIAAAKAGKDIYCEKPLTLTIAGGRALCNAVKRYGRVLQTGSHQRSISDFRFACELVRNGRIGRLHTIKVKLPGNNVDNPLNWQVMPVPKGFDYDMWLGPAQWAPYTKDRCHYTFRFLLDYSGGQMTNFGAHYFDIAQWGNGTDLTGPVEIAGNGQFPEDGLFTTSTKVHVEYTYANGVKMICDTGGSGGVRFEGSEGWISVSLAELDAHPKSLLKSNISPNEIHLYKSDDHKRNFLDCIKLRKKPVADVEIGHRSATICHLGNIAMLLGRKLNWNPDTERFVNDPLADSMLTRPMRAPWHL